MEILRYPHVSSSIHAVILSKTIIKTFWDGKPDPVNPNKTAPHKSGHKYLHELVEKYTILYKIPNPFDNNMRDICINDKLVFGIML